MLRLTCLAGGIPMSHIPSHQVQVTKGGSNSVDNGEGRMSSWSGATCYKGDDESILNFFIIST